MVGPPPYQWLDDVRIFKIHLKEKVIVIVDRDGSGAAGVTYDIEATRRNIWRQLWEFGECDKVRGDGNEEMS